MVDEILRLTQETQMDLKSYISLPGKSATGLARDTGVHPSTITRVAKGEMDPSVGLIRRIVAATEGAVTAEELVASAEAA